MNDIDNLFNRITVDPGNVTAWAKWGTDIYPKTGSFTNNRIKTRPLEEQLEYMWHMFNVLLKKYEKVSTCYIEGVEVWAGSLRSNVASKSGSLTKLTLLIGGYCRVCQQHGVGFQIILPTKWKGQLNDEMVRQRVFRANGNHYPNPHITDAVGIGLHFLGEL